MLELTFAAVEPFGGSRSSPSAYLKKQNKPRHRTERHESVSNAASFANGTDKQTTQHVQQSNDEGKAERFVLVERAADGAVLMQQVDELLLHNLVRLEIARLVHDSVNLVVGDGDELMDREL